MLREVSVGFLALVLPINIGGIGVDVDLLKINILEFEVVPASFGKNATLTFSFEFEEFGVYTVEIYSSDSYKKESIEGKEPLNKIIKECMNEQAPYLLEASVLLKWADFYGQYELPMVHVVVSSMHIFFPKARRHYVFQFPEKDVFDVEAKDGEYTSSVNLVYPTKYGISTGREIVSLENFNERKNIIDGRYFTLRDLTINYRRTYTGYDVDFYEMGFGTLSFIDYDNAYPYITATSMHSPRERIIPVTLIFYSREGDVFSYKISFDELYYNLKSNMMSSTKFAGYEKNDRYFYIPTNNLETISTTQFTLRFTLGLPNDFIFTYKFYLNPSDFLFGSCYDSYFCQVVEQSDGDLVEEERVEVSY